MYQLSFSSSSKTSSTSKILLFDLCENLRLQSRHVHSKKFVSGIIVRLYWLIFMFFDEQFGQEKIISIKSFHKISLSSYWLSDNTKCGSAIV